MQFVWQYGVEQMRNNYDNLKDMFKANLTLLEHAEQSDQETKELVVHSIIVMLLNFSKELEKTVNSVEFDFIPLSDSINDDETINSIINEVNVELN